MFRFGRVTTVCLLLAAALTTAAAAPHKRALLVAVTGYNHHHEGDPPELSTKADVQAIQQVLIHKFGFAPGEIRILQTPAETTHAAILHHFRNFLIDQTRPGAGDIVYFHYSGHGDWVPDTKGRKLNHRHECLVPSDFVSDYDKMHKGPSANRPFDNYILDDEIRDLLTALKRKRPGSVTLSFDSCYSGTVTRGRLPVRGLGGRDVYIPPDIAKTQEKTGAPASSEGKGAEAPLEKEGSDRLGYVVISATDTEHREPEIVGDGRQMGLLSWALTRSLANPPAQMTYRDLREELLKLTSQQNGDEVVPQLEGNLDRAVFDTPTYAPQPYLPVTVNDQGHLILHGGSLHGMTSGSRFSIYPAGTKRPTNAPLAEARIFEIAPTIARLELDPKYQRLKLPQLNNTRAFETVHQFGDDRLRVDVSALRDDPRWKEIEAALRGEGAPATSAIQLVTGAGTWDVRILQGKDLPVGAPLPLEPAPSPRDLVLVHADGTPFASIAAGPGLGDSLRERLAGVRRWRMLNALEGPRSARMGVRVGLRKVDGDKDVEGRIIRVQKSSPLKRGGLELHDGTYIQVKVTNLGSQPAYVTLLDLRPDGRIVQLFPDPELHDPSTGRFAPHQPQAADAGIYHIEKPYGVEILKVIATDRPTDFSIVVARNLARGVRGPLSPLQKLLQSATLGTRAVPVGAKASAYAVDTVPLVVKP